MKAIVGSALVLVMLAASVIATHQAAAAAATRPSRNAFDVQTSPGTLGRDDVEKMLRDWPPGPRLAGQEMMAKYGPPKEATADRLIWHQAGPYKRIMLTREELPHDFPLTHMDYLEHTISYNVPSDKTDEVHAFDASITIYRVAGELSARCDLESNNVLTLNLANDIVKGMKTVAAARQEFGKAVVDRTMGKPPPSTIDLLFQPMTAMAAADLEKTSLPGTSQRAGRQKMGLTGSTAGGTASADAEVLALIIALDENEVHAAMDAEQKKVGEATMAYAKTLHEEHGKHIGATEQLGAKIGVTPIETPMVDDVHNKGAEQLARIMPLTGSEFESSFADTMVNGHKDALQMLDEWSGKASHALLKQHLAEMRQHIERHLKAAEQLKGNR